MALVTVDQASDYFAGHIFGEEVWPNIPPWKQEVALVHAERDIKTLNYPRGWGGPSTAELRAAVCEQALFLLNRNSADRERIRAQQAGVKYRWVGDAREDYSGKPQLIAPEAMRILGRYVRLKSGGIR